jgi:hypothetical protein
MEDQELFFSIKDKSIQHSSKKIRDIFLILDKDLKSIFKIILSEFSRQDKTFDSFYRWLFWACENNLSLRSVKFIECYVAEGNENQLVIAMSLSDEYLISPLGITNNFDKFNWRYKLPYIFSNSNFSQCKAFDKINPIVELAPTEVLFLDEFINLANFIHNHISNHFSFGAHSV